LLKKINPRKLIINTLIFGILPIIINIIVESLGNKALFGGFIKLFSDPFVFLCNTLIIACTLSVGALLRRYRYCWIVVVSLVWLLLGFANFLLLCNRVLPLTVHDMQLLDLLSAMIQKYLDPVSLALVSLLVVILMLLIIILFLRAPRPEGKADLRLPVIFILVIFGLTFGNLKLGTTLGFLDTRFPELPRAYTDNGFVYSFTLSMVDVGVSKVDGYSEKLIDSITEDFERTDKSQAKTPNIILLQLESFFDVNSLNNMEFSENPLPNFTRLAQENGSGLLTVPTIGAGTVNTEFEIVTGMRMSDFGAGEYPYKTVLRENTCESIANNLKDLGYSSHFIHNYKATFYGRHNVYANLGYDYYRPIEDMTGYSLTENGWPEDSVLTDYIAESLDTTDGPDMITAVSVQAHGNYSDVSDYEKHVTLTECENESMRSSYEYYVNQIYEVDAFVGELIDYLSERGEDTVIVIYGDHLPSLDFKDSDLDGRGIYQTDYLIWNNIGIDYEDRDISTYEVNSRILGSLNIKEGVINSCHQRYSDDENYFYYLQALEYDMLYGKKYAFGEKNPYEVTEMNKKKRTFEILSVSAKEENVFTVSGGDFTESTLVRVGAVIVPTVYIDENTLEFKSHSFDFSDHLSLWEDGVGSSDPYFPQQ